MKKHTGLLLSQAFRCKSGQQTAPFCLKTKHKTREIVLFGDAFSFPS